MQSRGDSLGIFMLGVDFVVGTLVVVGLAATALSLRLSSRAGAGAPPVRGDRPERGGEGASRFGAKLAPARPS